MFDGNYRSRREINLSGGNKRVVAASSAVGKRATLQIAQEQRELRRKQLLQKVSACCIQKYVRGFLQKKSFWNNTRTSSSDREQQTLSILALRLSPIYSLFWSEEETMALLQRLATTNNEQPQSTFVSTRISYKILQLLFEQNDYFHSVNNLRRRVLQWVRNICEQDVQTLQNLFSSNNNKSMLLPCLQLYLQKPTYEEEEEDLFVTQTLYDLCVEVISTCREPSTATLLFAAAVVTTPSLRQHPLMEYMETKAATHPQLRWVDLFQLLSASLMMMCKSNDGTATAIIATNVNALVSGLELVIFENALDFIWDNATNKNNIDVVVSLVCFLQFAIQSSPQVIYYSSWLSLHERNSIPATSSGQHDQDDTGMNAKKRNAPSCSDNNYLQANDIDYDFSTSSSDEDDEEDYIPMQNNNNTNRTTITRTTNTAVNNPSLRQEQGESSIRQNYATIRSSRTSTNVQPSRAEFSTVKALDSYYKRYLGRQRNAGQTNDPRICKVSFTLGRGDLIQELGKILFSSSTASAEAKSIYIQILYQILSDSSGFRINSSPLLTKLAFHCHPIILTGLWDMIIRTSNNSKNSNFYRISSVFCDVFSHTLLPVDDEEFANMFLTATMPLLALSEVVCYLNQELFDVYWLHPVLLSTSFDGKDDDGRFRFLLSGTKLFNSLYDRWCRQTTTIKFCTEESWCWKFTVATNDAAAPVGAIASGNMNELEDHMDDDDDDDVQMEENATNNYHSRRQQEEEGEDALLANAFRDPKLARVLTACPQALSFIQRVQMFHSLLEQDKEATQEDTHQSMLRSMMMQDENFLDRHWLRVRVRREDLFADSLRQLNTLGKKLRGKVQVTMINKHGTEESGIDGGGVFKEFLDDLIREAFLPSGDGDGLFSVSPVESLYVNPFPAGRDGIDLLQQYEFLGRVLGKAVYESILVEPQFSLAFLNLILGKQNSLDDLKTFDPEIYRNLSSLRKMDETVLAGLGLTFEITSAYTNRGQFSNSAATISVPLMPNGDSIPVTKANVIQYVHLVAHHKLNIEGSIQTKAFLRGFRDLIPASWVRLFSASELQKLISGDDAVKGIDVDNMKRSMQYAGGYHPSQPIIMWFWEVLEEMSAERQRKFLKFMTSCSRQPLLGFQALIPLPCIQQIHLDDSNRDKLPTSSTCMNLLKLPKYDNKETLRDKLVYAIEAGAGFELT